MLIPETITTHDGALIVVDGAESSRRNVVLRGTLRGQRVVVKIGRSRSDDERFAYEAGLYRSLHRREARATPELLKEGVIDSWKVSGQTVKADRLPALILADHGDDLASILRQTELQEEDTGALGTRLLVILQALEASQIAARQLRPEHVIVPRGGTSGTWDWERSAVIGWSGANDQSDNYRGFVQAAWQQPDNWCPDRHFDLERSALYLWGMTMTVVGSRRLPLPLEQGGMGPGRASERQHDGALSPSMYLAAQSCLNSSLEARPRNATAAHEMASRSHYEAVSSDRDELRSQADPKRGRRPSDNELAIRVGALLEKPLMRLAAWGVTFAVLALSTLVTLTVLRAWFG